MRPHRRQPTRLPHPWDSPGKNTGMGCHFLLQCMKVKSESEVTQSCPTLSDPMDCSLPGPSIHGISQARVLDWGAIAFFELAADCWVLKLLLRFCCSKQCNKGHFHSNSTEHFFVMSTLMGNCSVKVVFSLIKIMYCCTDPRKVTFLSMYPLTRRIEENRPSVPHRYAWATHSRGKEWKAGSLPAQRLDRGCPFAQQAPRDRQPPPHTGRSTGVL